MNEANHLTPLFAMEERPLRRQDLPSYYRINGALYISQRLLLPQSIAQRGDL